MVQSVPESDGISVGQEFFFRMKSGLVLWHLTNVINLYFALRSLYYLPDCTALRPNAEELSSFKLIAAFLTFRPRTYAYGH
jgi:hypothetical protein